MGRRSGLWEAIRAGVSVWWNDDVFVGGKFPNIFTAARQPMRILDKLTDRVEFMVRDYINWHDPVTGKLRSHPLKYWGGEK